jgi:hypothetical protein
MFSGAYLAPLGPPSSSSALFACQIRQFEALVYIEANFNRNLSIVVLSDHFWNEIHRIFAYSTIRRISLEEVGKLEIGGISS